MCFPLKAIKMYLGTVKDVLVQVDVRLSFIAQDSRLGFKNVIGLGYTHYKLIISVLANVLVLANRFSR